MWWIPQAKQQICTNTLHAAFFTQGLKYPGVPSFSDEPGKMYILDLVHPKPTPVELQIKGELDLRSFNPHGISVYIDEAGEVQIRCSIITTEQRKERPWNDHTFMKRNIVKTLTLSIGRLSLVLLNSYEFNQVNIYSYCNNWIVKNSPKNSYFSSSWYTPV